MPSNLRWKVITILVVFVVFASVGVYPIVAARYGVHSPAWLTDKQLKLGLDLKGGVHLVLRVQTDDALRIETETEVERLREELTKRGITGATVTSPDSTHFRVEGVPPAQDAAFRQAAIEVQANFDRSAGTNGTYTFTMKPNIVVNLRDDSVVQARQTIERRVNELGVTEPDIAQQGEGGDEILVQLPGVTDVERAKEIIRSTGLLELKIVEQGPSRTAASPAASPRKKCRTCRSSCGRARCRRRSHTCRSARSGRAWEPTRSARASSRRSSACCSSSASCSSITDCPA